MRKPQIIQISLRLSTIYQHNQEYQKARSGFNWCRDSAKKYLAEDDSLNSKAFYGLTLDSLGRFMYDTGHYNESIPLMKESIELAQEIAPGDLERIGVLKINFSSILVETGEVTEALEILNTIIPEADSDLDSAAVQALVNQAIIYCSKNENKKLGKECLLRALQGALQLDSPELVLLVKRHAAKFNIIIA